MTTPPDYAALRLRCKKADGPNFALERDLAQAFEWPPAIRVPPWTADAQAVMDLIANVLPDVVCGVSWSAKGASASIYGKGTADRLATPALALLAALCAAKESGA